MSSLRARLIEFIEDELVEEGVSVGPDTELLLSGMVDSLGVIQIVGYLESDMGIAIDPGDVLLENFQSVSAMTAFAESQAGAA